MNIYSDSEAIELIINLYTFTRGYWVDEVKEYKEIVKFIEDGFTEYDKDYDELIRMNSDGAKFLHEYIKKYSEEVIRKFLHQGKECKVEELVKYFVVKYGIDDYLSQELCDYLIGNLHNYGYKGYKANSTRKGARYMIEEIA